MERTSIKKNLYNQFQYCKKVCLHKNGNIYEGVPLEKGWEDFDTFIKDNWRKYYRAVIKWANYKRVAPRKLYTGTLKLKPIRFTRKIKEKGFTLENTIFTSPSDSTKYRKTAHKYIFDDKLLGTRDIKRILKKRGIEISMETLVKRLKSSKPLFKPKEKSKFLWKGKYKSLIKIAKDENVNYDILKKRYYKYQDVHKALYSAKKASSLTRYDFEGVLLLASEISEILSKRTGLSKESIQKRFRKHGFDIEKLTQRKGYSGYSKNARPIIAEKDGKQLKFKCIRDAALELNCNPPNITNVLNGRIKNHHGYTFKDQ